MSKADPKANRRPLKSSSTGWAALAARAALATGLTANQISFLGIIIAALGALAVVEAADRPWLFVVAAACIQLRLLANMLDGMVAVEGGRGGPTGAIWNEFPDRIEDSLLLVAAGYAADPVAGLVLGLVGRCWRRSAPMSGCSALRSVRSRISAGRWPSRSEWRR